MTTTDTPVSAAGEGVEAGATTPPKPTVALPDDAASWLTLIRQCDAQIKELEETKKVARRHVEQFLGAYEVGAIDGRPVVHWTYVNSTRLDTSKLKAERPEVYDAFCKPQVTRRFSLVDPS